MYRLLKMSIAVMLVMPLQQTWALGDKSCGSESDSQAIEVLRAKVKSEKLYTSWAKEQCLSYYPEHCDAETVDVAIRELHTQACGGDPITGPVVDRFRIYKRSKNIDWLDHVDAEYREFSKIRAVRH